MSRVGVGTEDSQLARKRAAAAIIGAKKNTRSRVRERVSKEFKLGRCYGEPTIVAVPPSALPTNVSTSPMGLAIAVLPPPAKSRPTAFGLASTSCTMSDPESPLFRNLLPLFAITI